MQTLTTSFLIGVIFISFFKTNYALGVGFTLFSSVLLINDPSFLGWHGSGMENAITHVLFILALYLFYDMLLMQQIHYVYSIGIFLATISRIESIYHISPLLFLFAMFWVIYYKNLKGVRFLLLVILMWGGFHVLRYVYFGDFLPNTAYAQNISVIHRVKELLTCSPNIIYYTSLAQKIIKMHHGYLFVLCLPLIGFTRRACCQREKVAWVFLYAALCSLFLTALLNPYVFGRTRIDETRTTTQMALVSVVFISVILSKLKLEKRNQQFCLIAGYIVLSFFLIEIHSFKPYNLDFSTKGFLKFRSEFLELQRKHKLFRPTVANADLGIMSWYKDFNIVDLGLLGNPVLTRLAKQDKADYLFQFVAPDFLEFHVWWSCEYYYLFDDDRFKELYESARVNQAQIKGFCQDKNLTEGVWVRKDIKINSHSRERLLIEALQNEISLDAVKKEIDHCVKENTSTTSCLYVTRTVYRFLPEFVKKGYTSEQITGLFRASPSSKYDIAVLTSREQGAWYSDAIAFIKNHKNNKRF